MISALSNDNIIGPVLKPLMDLINIPGVAEIQFNRAGEVWIEKHGESAEPTKAPIFTLDYFWQLGRAIANRLNVIDFDKKPFMATTLPGGHRLQLCLGNTVLEGVAVSIRVYTNVMFPLDAYNPTADDLNAITNYNPDEWPTFATPGEEMVYAIEKKSNVVLTGGTFSSKTSFGRTILGFVPPKDRLVVIQDSPEIFIPQCRNIVQFIVNRLSTSEDIGYTEVIDAVTRLRPDRVIVGELSMENTWTLLRLLNTGHGGLLTTLHANSPQLAFEAITQNIALTGRTTDPRGATEYFKTVIDIIAHLQRVPGSSRRVVSKIYRKGDVF